MGNLDKYMRTDPYVVAAASNWPSSLQANFSTPLSSSTLTTATVSGKEPIS